jgi:uncharacterized protein YndB with AHSA1/START domain
MEDRIERSIELKAPIERVWQALADPQQFGSWFRVKIKTPFTSGQPASGHITYPGYEHVRWEVMIQTMDEPRLFSFTWHPFAIEPGVDYSTEQPTLVEFRLAPIDGGTRLTVTESGFSKLPAHRYADALRSNTGGWEEQMENIKAHVGR